MQLVKIFTTLLFFILVIYFSFLNLDINYVALEFILFFWLSSYFLLLHYQMEENKVANRIENFIKNVDHKRIKKQLNNFNHKKGVFLKFSLKEKKFIYNFDKKKIYIEQLKKINKEKES